MTTRVGLVALRAFLVVSLLGSALLQVVVLPSLAASIADQFPEVADLRYPTLALAIFVLGCLEVVLACVWVLSAATRRGEAFSASSLRWVDLICACLVSSSVAIAGLAVFDMYRGIGPITVPVFLGAILFVNMGFLSTMLVLRGLLIKATQLRTELDEVV